MKYLGFCKEFTDKNLIKNICFLILGALGSCKDDKMLWKLQISRKHLENLIFCLQYKT